MKKILIILCLVICLSACKKDRSDNSKLMYNPTTGLPMNCRTIIKENMDGYKSGKFTPEEALDSIDRNCGEFGYSWDETPPEKVFQKLINN